MSDINDRFASMLPAIPEGLAAENARLVAENKLLRERMATMSDFVYEGLNRPGHAISMLYEIEKALNGDYDPQEAK